MNISNNKENRILNKKSKDPFDIIIFEKGIRIHNLYADSEYKLMIILLNTGKAFKFSYRKFPKLNNASQSELSNFKLIGDGIGIHWNAIDEDLSLKGIIKEAVQSEALKRLESKDNSELAIF
ncbi:DUF2442 domain-containing protein [Daejeonella sp.]|uniref:DUF2442 domain-containing protein n=1 Tax=Daejeonella sp. TaxID=2805397 RepID=UPI0030C561AC